MATVTSKKEAPIAKATAAKAPVKVTAAKAPVQKKLRQRSLSLLLRKE